MEVDGNYTIYFNIAESIVVFDTQAFFDKIASVQPLHCANEHGHEVGDQRNLHELQVYRAHCLVDLSQVLKEITVQHASTVFDNLISALESWTKIFGGNDWDHSCKMQNDKFNVDLPIIVCEDPLAQLIELFQSMNRAHLHVTEGKTCIKAKDVTEGKACIKSKDVTEGKTCIKPKDVTEGKTCIKSKSSKAPSSSLGSGRAKSSNYGNIPAVLLEKRLSLVIKLAAEAYIIIAEEEKKSYEEEKNLYGEEKNSGEFIVSKRSEFLMEVRHENSMLCSTYVCFYMQLNAYEGPIGIPGVLNPNMVIFRVCSH